MAATPDKTKAPWLRDPVSHPKCAENSFFTAPMSHLITRTIGAFLFQERLAFTQIPWGRVSANANTFLRN